MKLTARLAAVAAVAVIAACAQGGLESSAPSNPASQGASPASSTTPTVEAIAPPTSLISPGKLVDCVDIEYPPMEFFPEGVTDPNQAIGFDVDAARAVADRLGLELQVRNTSFQSLIPDLQAGRCDIVWSALYRSEDRLKVADAVAYMATGHVIMVKSPNDAGIASADDLCGKTISIQSGGLVQTESAAASKKCTDAGKPAITIQPYKEVSAELQQLVLGRVQAVWETDTAVSDWILKHPGEYEVAFAFPPNKAYAVYFAKGKPDIGTAIGAALKSLKADGSLAAIAGQYQMEPATLDAIGT